MESLSRTSTSTQASDLDDLEDGACFVCAFSGIGGNKAILVLVVVLCCYCCGPGIETTIERTLLTQLQDLHRQLDQVEWCATEWLVA